MSNYLLTSYEILSRIYREKTFSTEALYGALEKKENPELVQRIVLGTLEKNVELDYILSQLTEKKPKPAVQIIVKQGLYCLKYMNSLPDYAVINNSVELIKLVGKFQLSGFVNAVLKRAAKGDYAMPQDDGGDLYLSVKLCKPAWLISLMIKEYGREKGVEILSEPPCTLSHVRANHRLISDEGLEKTFSKCAVEYEKTDVGGYLLKITAPVKQMFADGVITYQSYTSMQAVKALDVKDGDRVLDLCAAPGGKSVLIAERNPKTEVVACDVYPHRVELVEKYAARMKIKNVFAAQNDATLFNPEYLGKFDRVLVDAPCSALGIIRKQPDVLLNRTNDDIRSLAALQIKIAENAVKYVKSGGKMVYSTCTVTNEENGDNVRRLLSDCSDVSLIGEKQYLPKGCIDGFYVAEFIKK